MQVAGEEDFLSRYGEVGEFQINGAGLVFGAKQADGLQFVFRAGEGEQEGLSGVAENGGFRRFFNGRRFLRQGEAGQQESQRDRDAEWHRHLQLQFYFVRDFWMC